MRDIERYEDEYINRNDFEPFQVKYRRKMLLERIKKAEKLSGRKSLRILDVGIGMDPLFQYLTNFEQYVGIDPGKIFIENAKKIKQNMQRDNVCLYCGFAEKLDDVLKKEIFDMIIISGLLHEVENPQALLSSVLKFANSTTVVHINVPNSNSIHRLVAYECGMIESPKQLSVNDMRLQHNNVFDLNSLLRLINEVCNYKVVDTGTYFVKPFTHYQMQRLIDENIMDVKMLDGLYDVIKYMPDLGSELFVEFKIL